MSLGNMREHGVRSVPAICQETSCGQRASIYLDRLPDRVGRAYHQRLIAAAG
jgi:hypothetical protein